MRGPFKAAKVTDKVYWVGAVDWGIRNFHGYSTHRGTTYNAFLVLDEKITLVDAVKAPFRDEMLSRIASVVDPEKIEVIVSNHAEMDHSGCLMDVIERVKPGEVYASSMGVKALADHFPGGREITAVKDGEEICLGSRTLKFMETRMLHWPDSMFSYLVEDRLLFSQDAFGMHLAGSERFDDEIPQWLLEWEGSKYYANILLPYSNFVIKLIEKVKSSGLKFDLIAPDHGPIWRTKGAWIIDLYEKWASQRRTDKAVVIYDTMWGSTDLMARSVGEGLAAGGARVKLLPMGGTNRSDVATEVLDAGAVIVGSPTLNNNIFPTLGDVLVYLKGLRPLNKIGAAFGSYGWGGQSPDQLRTMLEEMGVEIVADSLKTKYVPDREDLEKCYRMGLSIAGRLPAKEKVSV